MPKSCRNSSRWLRTCDGGGGRTSNRLSTMGEKVRVVNQDDLLQAVQSQYAGVAHSSLSNESAAVRAVAEALAYSAEDLASMPPQANMGLSCGNPIALAGLQLGEVVLDLGCGGGVLKPGGRVAISDIALRQPLPDEVVNNLQTYVGCTAEAIQIDDYFQLLRDAGFDSVVVSETGADLNACEQAGTEGCCTGSHCGSCGDGEPLEVSLEVSQPLHDQLANVMARFDANAYAASVRIHAVKSSTASEPFNPIKENVMKTIQIYDRPMCCSTGVCGPSVDLVLPRFVADLDWLKSLGHQVDRYNLAQQPMAFTQNTQIHQLLATQGTDCLPVILVDGQVVSRGEYPSRDQLATWVGATKLAGSLPLAAGSSCCQSGNCC